MFEIIQFDQYVMIMVRGIILELNRTTLIVQQGSVHFSSANQTMSIPTSFHISAGKAASLPLP